MVKYRFAILIISDRCSRGEALDTSGALLCDLVSNCSPNLFEVVQSAVVPDERTEIKKRLVEWCSRGDLACILTSGGTGFSPRDVTPEVTKEVIEREATGIVHALLSGSLQATPFAMLSRLTAGIRQNTLIINFPGSRKACGECFSIVQPVLKHALDQLSEHQNEVAAVHFQIQSQDKSKVKEIPPSCRDRKSPYEMVSVSRALELIVEQIGNYFHDWEQHQHKFTRTALPSDLHKLVGCVLAEDLYALVPLPPFNASIKDGYAVIAADQDGLRRVLAKPSVAGSDSMVTLTPGHCTRISTGAALPPGADAVVQVEDTELVKSTQDGREEMVIRINSMVKVGQDIRPVGCDIPVDRDNPLLPKFTSLSAIDIGLIASIGSESVKVFSKPVVAVLSTGDEVITAGQARPASCIWDSNRPLLLTLLHESHFESIDLGIVVDKVDAIYSKIGYAFQKADVLITTGGVSMGERDLMKQVLLQDFATTIHFGRVNLKPGKPTTFGTCIYENKLKFIFALPGNPASAFVTFKIFVQPALQMLSGKYFLLWEEAKTRAVTVDLFQRIVKCKISLSKPYQLDSRPEFVRGILHFNCTRKNPNEHYLPTVILSDTNQISSRLLNIKDANALIMLMPRDKTKGLLNDGEIVDALIL